MGQSSEGGSIPSGWHGVGGKPVTHAAPPAFFGSVTPPGDDGLPTQEAEDHGTVAQ